MTTGSSSHSTKGGTSFVGFVFRVILREEDASLGGIGFGAWLGKCWLRSTAREAGSMSCSRIEKRLEVSSLRNEVCLPRILEITS